MRLAVNIIKFACPNCLTNGDGLWQRMTQLNAKGSSFGELYCCSCYCSLRYDGQKIKFIESLLTKDYYTVNYRTWRQFK